MSVGSNVVKITAKTALKDNWIKVMAVCMTLIFTVLISNYVSYLISILTGGFVAIVITAFVTVFLTLPLILGILRYVWRMLFSAKDNPVYVFYWFSSKKLYVRAMKFVGILTVRAVFWLAIFNIPTGLLYLFSRSFVFEIFDLSVPLWTANLRYYILLVENLAIVATVVAMLKYYLAPVIYVADDNIDANEAVHMSVVISKKSTADFIFLGFSFFGIIILSFLMLPLIFTLPYLFTAFAVHCRFAISEYNLHMTNMQSRRFNGFTNGGIL